MKRSVRRLPALILAAGVVIGLAACTPPVTNLAGCDAPFPSGDNSSAVTATGKVGSEPKVDFPTPLVAKDGQVSVLVKGDGPLVYPTNTVEYAISVFDPKSGEVSGSAGYNGTDVIRSIAGGSDVAATLAECVPAGSRIAFVGTSGSLVKDDDQPDSEGDTLIAVIDVLDTYIGKANGWDQLPQAGMPSVVLAPDGQPGVITPNEDAPTEQKVALLKAGTGAEVKDTDQVVVQYVAIPWGEKTVTVSTWEATQQRPAGPALITLDDQAPFPADIVIGQKVGSQVLAVVPKSGETPAHILVIDILKTIPSEG